MQSGSRSPSDFPGPGSRHHTGARSTAHTADIPSGANHGARYTCQPLSRYPRHPVLWDERSLSRVEARLVWTRPHQSSGTCCSRPTCAVSAQGILLNNSHIHYHMNFHFRQDVQDRAEETKGIRSSAWLTNIRGAPSRLRFQAASLRYRMPHWHNQWRRWCPVGWLPKRMLLIAVFAGRSPPGEKQRLGWRSGSLFSTCVRRLAPRSALFRFLFFTLETADVAKKHKPSARKSRSALMTRLRCRTSQRGGDDRTRTKFVIHHQCTNKQGKSESFGQ
jgi:hypothetical protein